MPNNSNKLVLPSNLASQQMNYTSNATTAFFQPTIIIGSILAKYYLVPERSLVRNSPVTCRFATCFAAFKRLVKTELLELA
jgi:hypothetical protein